MISYLFGNVSVVLYRFLSDCCFSSCARVFRAIWFLILFSFFFHTDMMTWTWLGLFSIAQRAWCSRELVHSKHVLQCVALFCALHLSPFWMSLRTNYTLVLHPYTYTTLFLLTPACSQTRVCVRVRRVYSGVSLCIVMIIFRLIHNFNCCVCPKKKAMWNVLGVRRLTNLCFYYKSCARNYRTFLFLYLSESPFRLEVLTAKPRISSPKKASLLACYHSMRSCHYWQNSLSDACKDLWRSFFFFTYSVSCVLLICIILGLCFHSRSFCVPTHERRNGNEQRTHEWFYLCFWSWVFPWGFLLHFARLASKHMHAFLVEVSCGM